MSIFHRNESPGDTLTGKFSIELSNIMARFFQVVFYAAFSKNFSQSSPQQTLLKIYNLPSHLLHAVCFFKALLIDEEVDGNTLTEKEQKKESKLKRSKSAMSSKFKVIKKTKKIDRNTRKTLPSKLTEVLKVCFN